MPKYMPSRRSCRGKGWHRKGYRDGGCMWLNLKRAYCEGPFTRGADYNENMTIGEMRLQAVSQYLSPFLAAWVLTKAQTIFAWKTALTRFPMGWS